MSVPARETEFVEKARRVYDETLKEQLEAEHSGELIALEPDSGEFVLGRDFMSLFRARHDQFGEREVYIFRIGGGAAVRIGGAVVDGRVS